MKTIRFRTIFITLGIVTALCVLSPVAIGLLAAGLTYDGNCYGFTDGVAPCSWWQFAQTQMFWGAMIAFSPAIFIGMGWLTTLGLWFALGRLPAGSKLPAWQGVLIPLVALAIGLFLIAVIPVLTGLRR